MSEACGTHWTGERSTEGLDEKDRRKETTRKPKTETETRVDV